MKRAKELLNFGKGEEEIVLNVHTYILYNIHKYII